MLAGSSGAGVAPAQASWDSSQASAGPRQGWAGEWPASKGGGGATGGRGGTGGLTRERGLHDVSAFEPKCLHDHGEPLYSVGVFLRGAGCRAQGAGLQGVGSRDAGRGVQGCRARGTGHRAGQTGSPEATSRRDRPGAGEGPHPPSKEGKVQLCLISGDLLGGVFGRSHRRDEMGNRAMQPWCGRNGAGE